jgi:hypothetical protein
MFYNDSAHHNLYTSSKKRYDDTLISNARAVINRPRPRKYFRPPYLFAFFAVSSYLDLTSTEADSETAQQFNTAQPPAMTSSNVDNAMYTAMIDIVGACSHLP